MKPLRLLHITAHLGGGVGKVLSRLAEASARSRDGLRHVVACLEVPEKPAFAEHLRAHGGELHICPDRQELAELIADADVVQLEWWHHPVLAGWMCGGILPAMRLVVWSHVSGLHVPALTPAFVTTPQRFLFSSPCSWSNPTLAAIDEASRRRVDAIFSSGGFDDLPAPPERSEQNECRVGYLGTLNFAKLHPGLLDFLAEVDLPDFSLALVGDPTTGAELLRQAECRGLADRIEIRGYRSDVAAELAKFDLLAYLLNPLHYGTTENALLEAMAMGVVPIVLDNPAERQLVRHEENGLVVHGPTEFAAALRRLATRPGERRKFSQAASWDVRNRFAVENTSARLLAHYRAVMAEEKRAWDFRPVFGTTPSEWFVSCQGSEAWRFREDGSMDLARSPPHVLLERSKGSIFHYQRAFPEDRRLAAWAQELAAWEVNRDSSVFSCANSTY